MILIWFELCAPAEYRRLPGFSPNFFYIYWTNFHWKLHCIWTKKIEIKNNSGMPINVIHSLNMWRAVLSPLECDFWLALTMRYTIIIPSNERAAVCQTTYCNHALFTLVNICCFFFWFWWSFIFLCPSSSEQPCTIGTILWTKNRKFQRICT